MQQNWRPVLKKNIEDRYIRNPQEEWYDFTLSTSGALDLTIVSDCFEEIPLSQRDEQILELLHESNAPTATGYLSLYTLSEADTIGLPRPPVKQESTADNWSDLAREAMNPSDHPEAQRRKPRIPHTVTFYSFKGGVGRTTALIHVAWILAMRGRKVVAVDLDLEAPGLSALPNLTPVPEHGIVDYFYERTYIPRGVEPIISIVDIFGEIRIPNAPGRFFVVPVGSLNLDYITKLEDLRASAVTEHGEDLWSVFFREINDQLQPDIILVDSRTGINEWGAFSLLRAADQAIVFLYPNEQNKRGVDLLLQALADRVSLQLIFSPVPFGDAGMEKVKEYWQLFQDGLNAIADQPDSNIDEAVQKVETQPDLTDPITINYITEIALASSYPVQSFLLHYTGVANVVDEDTFTVGLEALLEDQRQELLESLTFPAVNPADPSLDLNLFQRTADFKHILDDTTSLIRGQKGTGKTALYKFLLQYKDIARELSYRRSDRVICLSGHARSRGHPTSADFQFIDQSIKQNGGSWEAFWFSYVLLRIYMEDHLLSFEEGASSIFNQFWSVLDEEVPRGVVTVNEWQEEHTRVLAKMATTHSLDMLSVVLLHSVDQWSSRREMLWFLYDDLDKALLEEHGLRNEALTGLFQFVSFFETLGLRGVRQPIRFKIFLPEDVWSQLAFANKSYFNGRSILLQWTREDFLRLALRQALHSEKFKDLVVRFAPVENVDQADEALIDRALQLLWGVRREPNSKSQYVSRWIYDQLQDASGTAFPGSVNILLTEAKKHELISKLCPPDRLLPAVSLEDGLLQASRQHCAEIRKEYPQLTPFFDALADLEALISERALREVWQKTLQEISPKPEDVIGFLLDIGLIKLAEPQGKERYCQFAEIYAYGFNMHRRRSKY